MVLQPRFRVFGESGTIDESGLLVSCLKGVAVISFGGLCSGSFLRFGFLVL